MAVVPPTEQDKGKDVVMPLEVVPQTPIQVPPMDGDEASEQHPSGTCHNYGHYHEENGPTHFCKVIMAPKLEAIPILLDFTKHFSPMPIKFKLKANTSFSWRIIARLMNSTVTLEPVNI
ncbi:U-box domain-containing protein 4 [Hordeum vulgare]|nr:U-box domain-containing protein 4 [Hordeum vulgare]